jgi:hypothetical protein
MIGKELSPILVEIEQKLWEFEFHTPNKPEYSEQAFRAACKIFMSALLDKMWNLQENEDLEIEDRLLMAEKAGQAMRSLVKTYTDIDTHKFYEGNE